MPLKKPANILIHAINSFHCLSPSEKIHWALGYIFIGKSQIPLNPGYSVSCIQNISKKYFLKVEVD